MYTLQQMLKLQKMSLYTLYKELSALPSDDPMLNIIGSIAGLTIDDLYKKLNFAYISFSNLLIAKHISADDLAKYNEEMKSVGLLYRIIEDAAKKAYQDLLKEAKDLGLYDKTNNEPDLSELRGGHLILYNMLLKEVSEAAYVTLTDNAMNWELAEAVQMTADIIQFDGKRTH